MQTKTRALLIGIPAGIASLITWPAPTEAVTNRQYNGNLCTFYGDNLKYLGAGVANDRLWQVGANFGDLMECPIVEDSGLQAKGGTVVQATLWHRTSNERSQLYLCVDFSASVGGWCSLISSSTATVGAQTLTVTAGANPWTSLGDYGYLQFYLGARGTANGLPDVLTGYWTTRN